MKYEPEFDSVDCWIVVAALAVVALVTWGGA
jgi:hypothetical protein